MGRRSQIDWLMSVSNRNKELPRQKDQNGFSDGDSDWEENFFMDNLRNRDYLLSEEGITSIVYTSNLLRSSSCVFLEELDKG